MQPGRILCMYGLCNHSYSTYCTAINCDRAYENQPSGCIKIALFFQLCPDPFEITTQIFTTHAEVNGESFKAYRMLIFYLELEVFIVK